jgi:drug/metabolite transporter (DMT)-like permease
MRILTIIGVLLIIVGLIALAVQGVTFFSQERVVDVGPVKVDVEKPHTIAWHPLAGIAAVVAGLVLVAVGTRRAPS